MHTPQTYPFTRYYLRVPSEYDTWVPLRIGDSAIPEYWETKQAALDYAMFAACLLRFKLIQVTEVEITDFTP